MSMQKPRRGERSFMISHESTTVGYRFGLPVFGFAPWLWMAKLMRYSSASAATVSHIFRLERALPSGPFSPGTPENVGTPSVAQ